LTSLLAEPREGGVDLLSVQIEMLYDLSKSYESVRGLVAEPSGQLPVSAVTKIIPHREHRRYIPALFGEGDRFTWKEGSARGSLK
jgi:hypothetical protein